YFTIPSSPVTILFPYTTLFRSKSVFSPSQEVKEEAVQNVLQTYLLPNSKDALKDRITQINIEGQVLQITINTYPAEADSLQKIQDRKSTRLNSSHVSISYAVFC